MTTGITRFTNLGWNQPSYQVSTQATSSTQVTPIGFQFSKEHVDNDGFYPGLTLSNKTTDPLAAETGVVKSSYTQLHNPAEVADGLGAYAAVAKYLANPVARESVANNVQKFDSYLEDWDNANQALFKLQG